MVAASSYFAFATDEELRARFGDLPFGLIDVLPPPIGRSVQTGGEYTVTMRCGVTLAYSFAEFSRDRKWLALYGARMLDGPAWLDGQIKALGSQGAVLVATHEITSAMDCTQ